jgi:hypothetical protein
VSLQDFLPLLYFRPYTVSLNHPGVDVGVELAGFNTNVGRIKTTIVMFDSDTLACSGKSPVPAQKIHKRRHWM